MFEETNRLPSTNTRSSGNFDRSGNSPLKCLFAEMSKYDNADNDAKTPIDPFNLLPFKFNSVSFERRPNSLYQEKRYRLAFARTARQVYVGKVPKSRLSFNSKLCNHVRAPIALGIVDVSRVVRIVNSVSRVKPVTNDSGFRVPFNELVVVRLRCGDSNDLTKNATKTPYMAVTEPLLSHVSSDKSLQSMLLTNLSKSSPLDVDE